jgi:hypothetical protein
MRPWLGKPMSKSPIRQGSLNGLSVRLFLGLQFSATVAENRISWLGNPWRSGVIEADQAIAIRAGEGCTALHMEQEPVRGNRPLRCGKTFEEGIGNIAATETQ